MRLRASKPVAILLLLAAVILAVFVVWRQSMRPGQSHYDRGLDEAAANRMDRAEREWLAGTRSDPEFAGNYIALGDLYSAMGRPKDAVERYRTAARVTPDDGKLSLKLAHADEAAHDEGAAIADAKRAAGLLPSDPDALSYYGALLARMNQPSAAIPVLRRTLSLTPDNADALIYLVRAEIQQRDFVAAEGHLSPFVQRHPGNAEACYLMAYLLHQKPQTPENLRSAIDYATRAHNGAPANDQASTLLGQLLLSDGKPVDALSAFRQAQSVTPLSQPVLTGLIACYTRLGQPDLARQTSATLAAVVARRERLALLQDHLTQHPEDTAAALQAARLEEANQNLSLAHSYFAQAVAHAPGDPGAKAALDAFLKRQRVASSAQ